jgi:hypothetical protein
MFQTGPGTVRTYIVRSLRAQPSGRVVGPRASWSQIRREIDYLGPGIECPTHPWCRSAMRERGEDERAPFEIRVVMGNEAYLLPAEPGALTPALICTGEVEAQARMMTNEGAQLASGITGGAEHPNGKFMHG